MVRVGQWYRVAAISIVIVLIVGWLPATVRASDGTATPVITASDTFPAYSMDLFLDVKKRTLAGSMSVEWTNTTGETQDEIYFRLYPNAEYYDTAETLVEDVRIDDEPVEFASPDDTTVLQVTPSEPVADGESATIAMTFSTLIPVDSASGFGIFQLSSDTGIWNLANWYPVIAAYEPGTGWYLQEPTVFGDPTFGETSTYNVTVEIPQDLALISTGETVATQLGLAGTDQHIIETGPARELAMTLLPAAVDEAEVTADDTTVRVTLPDAANTPGLAEFMAETAADALGVYESWMGEYPSPEFDISVAGLSGANGVSWSGLTWFDLDQITADGQMDEREKTGLTFVILHEVGHQWIADVVGSNNNDHGFMTEGLTNALAVLAAEEIYGPEQADLYLRSWVAGPYSSLLNDGRDGVADAPITDESNGVIRSLLIYGKAAVGFIAIREEIGDEAFLDALDTYATEFRFGVSEPDDLLAAFETASGEDLDELWSFWFYEADATTRDLDTVLNAFSA